MKKKFKAKSYYWIPLHALFPSMLLIFMKLKNELDIFEVMKKWLV